MDALVFVPPILLGIILLVGYKRFAARLLDAEYRYGSAEVQARAKTAKRQRQARVVTVVWCLLFISFSVGGLLQNL